MKKCILSIICTVVLVSGVAFAGGQKQSSGTTGAKTLTVWSGLTETGAPLKKAASLFMASNPNAKVNVLVYDLRDFETKVAAAAAGGSLPDLIVADQAAVLHRYINGGYLASAPTDVVDYVQKSGRYLSVAVKSITVNGSVYAVPLYGGGPALFYNKTYFGQAGLSTPPTTVSQVAEYAPKLTEKDASGSLTRAGITLRLTGAVGGIQKWDFIAYQMVGGQFLLPGKKPGTFHANMDNEGSARALMWWVNLLHGKNTSDNWSLKADAEGFADGSAAMLERESYVVPYLQEHAPNLKYGVAYLPRDKYWGIYDWLVGIAVSKSSPNQELAWKFALSTQEKSVLSILLQQSGWIPSRRDITFDQILQQQPNFKPFIDDPQGATIYYEPALNVYDQLWRKAGEIMQQAYRDPSLLNNLAGCRAVVKKANEAANTILKQAGEYGE